MEIVREISSPNVATVYIAKYNNKYIEFVESIQPPLTKADKWVLIISSLYGCPIQCKFCDSSSQYGGKLSVDELISQVDYMVNKNFSNREVKTKKFKVQFARIGEPSLNMNVITAIEKIDELYKTKNFIPSISTIAPVGRDDFFEELLILKKRKFKYNFQLQFSIHSTNSEYRDWLIPVKKWGFKEIALYGERFFDEKGKKITLNFAIKDDKHIDETILKEYFTPEKFLIKITPINPTVNAIKHNLSDLNNDTYISVKNRLIKCGYDVIISIGNLEENKIGSNCGQYIKTFLEEGKLVSSSYTYVRN